MTQDSSAAVLLAADAACMLCKYAIFKPVQCSEDIDLHIPIRVSVGLQSINLANNSLTGTLPAAISNMSLLTSLNLGFNSLR